jgi:hypothetical protein
MADPNYVVLPAGIAQSEFTQALRKFAEIVGTQNVLTTAEQLKTAASARGFEARTWRPEKVRAKDTSLDAPDFWFLYKEHSFA